MPYLCDCFLPPLDFKQEEGAIRSAREATVLKYKTDVKRQIEETERNRHVVLEKDAQTNAHVFEAERILAGRIEKAVVSCLLLYIYIYIRKKGGVPFIKTFYNNSA